MKYLKSNLLAGASLLLFVAIAALGIASYWQTIRFEWTQNHQYQQWQQIGVDRGSFYVLVGGTTHDAVDDGTHSEFRHDDVDDFAYQRDFYRRRADRNWWLPGVEWIHWVPEPDRGSGFEYGDAVYVSTWLVLLLAAAAVVRIMRMIQKNRRVLAEMCAACGYDLRATPDRCPECGTAVTDKSERQQR